MTSFIDLSCDLGEASTEHERAIEAELFPLITSANIACGGHTGSVETMAAAVETARRHNVAVGAHPSYPDRENFGRKTMQIERDALFDSLREQLSTLCAIAQREQMAFTHVKPHGALYNDAHHDRDLARVVIDVIESIDRRLAIVCSRTSAMHTEATSRGIRAIAEGFGDRRYQRSGELVPRSRGDALLLDINEAAQQACAIATSGRVVADDGTEIELAADTICIHSDMPDAVARLRAIRAALQADGFAFRSPYTSRHES